RAFCRLQVIQFHYQLLEYPISRLTDDLNEVRNLVDHAAYGRRVLQLADRVESAQAQATHRCTVRFTGADQALDELDLDSFIRHGVHLSPEYLRRTCRASPRCRPVWTAYADRRALHERGCTGSSNRGSWPQRSARPSRRTLRASGRQRSRRYRPWPEPGGPSMRRAYRALRVAGYRS